MKGVVSKFLGIIALVTFVAILVFYVRIQTELTATEAPVKGIITAFFGFLPKVCITINTPECMYCLITQKIVPLVANTILTIALITVAFSVLGQIKANLPSMYVAISMMGLGVGILSVHFNTAFIGSGLLGVAALTLALNLLGIVPLPGRFTDFLILTVIMSVIISGTGILWGSLLPVRIIGLLFFKNLEFPSWEGIGPLIAKSLGLPIVDCGDNVIGPESFS